MVFSRLCGARRYVKGAYSLLGWCNQITALENSPLVHSVSYGNDEKQQVLPQSSAAEPGLFLCAV